MPKRKKTENVKIRVHTTRKHDVDLRGTLIYTNDNKPFLDWVDSEVSFSLQSCSVLYHDLLSHFHREAQHYLEVDEFHPSHSALFV